MAPSSQLTVLRRRAEFLDVAQNGKKWVAPNLILQAGLPRENGSVRYGLTATTRIGNAVIRNRARRRLRALAFDLLAVHAAPNRDYVLIAKQTTAGCDYEDLKKDLTLALKKLEAGAMRERIGHITGSMLRGLIGAYRHSFSYFLGQQCRFLPTCSAYASEAIRVHGSVRGTGLAFRRFCRCHPFERLGAGEGFDPVPPHVSKRR